MARGAYSSSNYMQGAVSVGAVPLTIACWLKCPTVSANQVIVATSDPTAATSNGFGMRLSSGSKLVVISVAAGTVVTASVTPTIPNDVWFHACATFTSTSSRAIYQDGANKATNSTSNSPITSTHVTLGMLQYNTSSSLHSQRYQGVIADLCVYNVALSDAEVLQLATGFSPLMVRPGDLVWYTPLIRGDASGNDIDLIGGAAFTETGTVNVVNQPRLFRPAPLWVVPFSTTTQTVTPDLITSSVNVYAPTLSVGMVIVTPDAISDASVVYAPTLSVVTGNSLLNNLIAYWPFNEAAGDALDLHGNGLTLTEYGTPAPGAATGLVYASVRDFDNTAEVEQAFRRDSEALLVTGDVDYTYAVWIKPLPGTQRLLTKMFSNGVGEFAAYRYPNGICFFEIILTADGYFSIETTATAPNDEWSLIVLTHEATAKRGSVIVNNVSISDTYSTESPVTSTVPFAVGGFGVSSGSDYGGLLGPVVFWKSDPDDGGALTTDQLTALYNDGAGLAYAEFDNGGGETQSITPDAIGSTAAVYAPMVAVGAVTVAPDAIASTATVYAPTITTGLVVVAPNVISSAEVVYTPIVSVGVVTVAPDYITTTSAINAPSVMVGAVSVIPGVIASTEVVYTPVVSVGAITAFPDFIVSTSTVYAHVVTVGTVTVSPDLIVSTATVYAPDISSGYVIYPDAISSVAAIYTPTVTVGALTVFPDSIGSTETVYTPTLTAGIVTVTPDAIAGVAQVRTVVVTVGTITVIPNAVGSISAVYEPVITVGDVTVIPDAIASAETVYTPLVSSGPVIGPDAIASIATIYAVSVSVGAVTVIPDVIESVVAVYAPTVTPDVIAVMPDVISGASTVYAPAVTIGAITIVPDAIASVTQVYSIAITTGTVIVSPDAISNQAIFYAPLVRIASDVTISPDAITGTAQVFTMIILAIVAGRIRRIGPESRINIVDSEGRAYTVDGDGRIDVIGSEGRLYTTGNDLRIYSVED